MGENLGYGAAANRAVAGLDASVGWVLVSNPDIVLGPGSLDTLLEAAGPVAAGGRARPADPHRRGGVPLGAAAALARAGRGPRGVRRDVAGQPVDALLPSGGFGRGADGGLALRLVRAAAPRGLGLGRRLRPAVLHVLRGRRPRRPARAGGLAQRLRAGREVVHTGGHATTRDAPTSTRMLREHHRSAYRFLVRPLHRRPVGPAARRAAAALAARARWSTRGAA